MKKIFLLTLIILITPFIIVGCKNYNDIIIKIKYGSYSNKVIKVKRVKKGRIDEVPIETYVLGVVAGEMPVSFNLEALKAQAVTSRTYAYKMSLKHNDYDVLDTTSNQVYLDSDDLKNRSSDDNIKKLQAAVNTTNGLVLLYNNELIDALFFSTSNGYTENCSDVFTGERPYLVSVSSNWDKTESPVFSSSKTITKKEFLFALGIYDDVINISNIVKTKTGRVKTITINNKVYKSSDIRKIFDLRSTSFNINVNGDDVTFNVQGFGHGVGLSQYGANGMAKDGYNYQQILSHYYTGVKIKKIN